MYAVLSKNVLHLHVIDSISQSVWSMLGTRSAKIFSNAAATVEPFLSLTGTANAYPENTLMQVSMLLDVRFVMSAWSALNRSSIPLRAFCDVGISSSSVYVVILSFQPSLDRFNRHSAVSSQCSDVAVQTGLVHRVLHRFLHSPPFPVDMSIYA